MVPKKITNPGAQRDHEPANHSAPSGVGLIFISAAHTLLHLLQDGLIEWDASDLTGCLELIVRLFNPL